MPLQFFLIIAEKSIQNHSQADVNEIGVFFRSYARRSIRHRKSIYAMERNDKKTSHPTGASNKKRLSWDEYFMQIAEMVAERSTCPRKKVGAVLVKDHIILSTGYNGSIRGLEHCDDVGCMVENGHCIATIHAEANAIIQAARHGTSVSGSSAYVTASPCWNCFKLLANAGINRIAYREFYRDDRIFEVAQKIGIKLTEI